MSETMQTLRFLSPTIMLAIGFIIVIFLSFINCKKHNLSKLATLGFIVFGYAGGIYGAALMGDFYSYVSEKFGGGDSRLAIFGCIVALPFLLIAASLITGKSWRDVNDLFAPGAFLGLAFSKFGCFTFGCCPGIECEFGFYNYEYHRVMFPSQLVESITMCFVVGFSFWYNYKYKKKIPGTAYPATAIVYAITRFLWEFMRYYDIDRMKHLFMGLSFWQLWCIAIVVVSCIWIIVLKNTNILEYEKRYYSYHQNIVNRVKERLISGKRDEQQA